VATVDAVMTAAAQVLVREGYNRANTGLIAAAAGVSIGTLYQYYPNKDAVFSELLRRHLEAVATSMTDAVAAVREPSLAAHVRAAVGGLLASKARNPRLNHTLKTELGRLDGDRMARSLMRRSLDLTEQMLAMHGIRDPGRAAFMVVNAVEGVVSALLIDAPGSMGDPATADELTAMVVSFLQPAPLTSGRSPT
jgi:AcrR family transcriptional regulator